MKQKIVVALGGNALARENQKGDIHDQIENAKITAEHIADLIQAGHDVVITHGNGPQVGNILRRVEAARAEVYTIPLDVCVADSQGGIGYVLQQCLQNSLFHRKIYKNVVTLLTQMAVDPNDSAFQEPSKPIGPFIHNQQEVEKRRQEGWQMVDDAGRGWRRVVASPRPIRIIEANVIKQLYERGSVVIACGGGGIPVSVDGQGTLSGVEAVIDKDRGAAILAHNIGADVLLIATATDQVCLRYGKPDQVNLPRLTCAEAEKYMTEGHFPPGSMGPKIEASIAFLRKGGKLVIITTPENMLDALKGETGTRVVP